MYTYLFCSVCLFKLRLSKKPPRILRYILVKRDNSWGGSILKGSSTQKRSFTATATVSATSDIQATTQIPEIKVLDFLTGLFKMFNLTSFQNEDGTIEIKTLDSFYRGTTLKPVVTYDITKEIDKTDLTVDSVLPFKTVSLKYQGLDSFLAKSHNELFNVEWGSLHYSGNEDSKLEGQTYTVEVPFEHFKYERFIDVTGGATKNVQYGWSADIDQNSYLGKPLLFYAVKASESLRITTFLSVKPGLKITYLSECFSIELMGPPMNFRIPS